MSTPDPVGDPSHGQSLRALAFGALGIVYGDIGTSPLYAIKECFHGPHAVPVSEQNVLGVLSLIFWSLTVVVSIKYLAFFLRADNQGEGGIFALLALIKKPRRAIVLTALFAAALLYGDGIITPAISVLSAVEGLEQVTTAARPFVLPITCGVIIGLFLMQRRGTAGIGRIFGPVMLVWFAVLAVLGASQIVDNPTVLRGLNPWYAIRFFIENRFQGFVVLGSVVLCITGGEALYADLGHFGRRPIRVSWYALVFPALLLNYFGQGALLLTDPATARNPFFSMVPQSLLIPAVALAASAAVIASQALISGAFSLTRQAVQLGFLPRVHIVHTSGQTEGQIYIPSVNNVMMLACLGLVLAFRESSNLAAAYGIAVTLTMTITSILYYLVVRDTWGWSRLKAVPLLVLFLIFDLTYLGANALKIPHGGWFPLTVAFGLLIVMTTWSDGRRALAADFARRSIPLDLFLEDVAQRKPIRVAGTAVFMSSAPTGTSPVLLHHLKHNQVLHEVVIILSIQGRHVPAVPADEQVEMENLGEGFYRVTAWLGFMETPNVPAIMVRATQLGLLTDPMKTSFYLGRETLLTDGRSGLWRWRKILFSFIQRNARSATAYFGLPPGRVIELGMQIDL